MKKIITHTCLSFLIALPLLPSFMPVRPDTVSGAVQPMSYFEDVKELY